MLYEKPWHGDTMMIIIDNEATIAAAAATIMLLNTAHALNLNLLSFMARVKSTWFLDLEIFLRLREFPPCP